MYIMRSFSTTEVEDQFVQQPLVPKERPKEKVNLTDMHTTLIRTALVSQFRVIAHEARTTDDHYVAIMLGPLSPEPTGKYKDRYLVDTLATVDQVNAQSEDYPHSCKVLSVLRSLSLWLSFALFSWASLDLAGA